MISYTAKHWIAHIDSSIVTSSSFICDYSRFCEVLKDLKEALFSFLKES